MADILRWKSVASRRPHRCFGCGKTYKAGTSMVSAAYADGGGAFSAYWCKTCKEYMRRYFKHGDETGAGEIYEGDPEGWERLRLELDGSNCHK